MIYIYTLILLQELVFHREPSKIDLYEVRILLRWAQLGAKRKNIKNWHNRCAKGSAKQKWKIFMTFASKGMGLWHCWGNLKGISGNAWPNLKNIIHSVTALTHSPIRKSNIRVSFCFAEERYPLGHHSPGRNAKKIEHRLKLSVGLLILEETLFFI